MVDMGQYDARKTTITAETDGVFSRHRERVRAVRNMQNYSVVVGNVGTVFSAICSEETARSVFNEWAEAARTGSHVRAYGEPVHLFSCGELLDSQDGMPDED